MKADVGTTASRGQVVQCRLASIECRNDPQLTRRTAKEWTGCTRTRKDIMSTSDT